MAVLESLPLDGLRPSSVWSALDPDTRRLAGRAVYLRGWDDGSARAEIDAAICDAIRFRPLMVRRMPVDKRVDHLLRSVRPDDDVASTLLLALHMVHRRGMLCVFLDELGIPHEQGLIEDEPEPPDDARLGETVRRLYEEFSRDEVDVYLATLLASDERVWGGLRDALSSPSR